ncbi:MAG: M10 family metallopeptidase C-terminal domain-containing protein [Sphingomicrobium sp.]
MATIYVSPLGSGTGSGLSAANAKPFSSLNGAIKAAGPGGSVLLLADQGNYAPTSMISLTAGGLPGAPVTLMGVDSSGHPVDIQIYGTRPPYSAATAGVGTNVIRLLDGANNLTFQGFDFHNVQSAFTLAATLQNITIQDMEGYNVRYFINNNAAPSSAAPTATVTGLTIRDVEVHGFSKSVVKLQYDTNHVVLDNVYGDSEYQDGDTYAMGVMLSGTVHDVLIENSTMLNCVATGATGSYWNGDGFVTERGVYNVRFEHTYAGGNGDGGYDLKSSYTVLVDAVAEDNNRNFRLWGTNVELINPVGIDPHTRGGSGSQVQVWLNDGASVKITGGYFVDAGSATQVFSNTAGSLTLSGTSVWHASSGSLKYGPVGGLDLSLVHDVGASGLWSTGGEMYLPDRSGLAGPGSDPSVTPGYKTMTGTSGNDILAPSAANHWTVNGGDGNDRVTTLGGNDTLNGGNGNDTLSSGAGNDLLRGGAGADILTGGAGSDLFDFNATTESPVNAPDIITDFEHGIDKIDLVQIDANAGASGNQAFTFIDGAAFSGKAGQLRVDHSDPTKTVVYGDVNGDGVADFAIHVVGNVPLSIGDFLL